MPFGLASAASVFQRIMEEMFSGMTGVRCFQDDILVTGENESVHDERVCRVMKVLKERGLTIQLEKCRFKENSVSYLGHTIDGDGIHPKRKLVEAVLEAAAPSNKDELRSFLGLAEYYSKFVQNFANITSPMRELLKNGVKYVWSKECEEAFGRIKEAINTASALTAFEPRASTCLFVDASNKGLGAALIQRQNGEDCIIAFASRALKPHEENYSTIEKEALACWWAVNYFRNYLWGAPFLLKTDHKPLTGVFSTKGTQNVSNRIVRWVMDLQRFNFTVVHLPGKSNSIADYLSRQPVREEEEIGELSNDIQEITDENPVSCFSAITKEEWLEAMREDVEYQDLVSGLREGVRPLKQRFPKYESVWEQLSLSEWGVRRAERWVPPGSLKEKIVSLAHEGHIGRNQTKRKVRSLYWWPMMDKQLEECVKNCTACANSDKVLKTHKEPLEPVHYELRPWYKLALDIIGPVHGLPLQKRFGLVLVDYFSKWYEVKFVQTVSTSVVIDFLATIMQREGAPCELVTDNGVQFVSQEMERFLKEWGIRHVKTSVYNPKGNGVVERLNRVIKENLQLSKANGLKWEENLKALIWSHRVTPNAVTGETPFYLMRGRMPTSHFAPAWQKREQRQVDVPTMSKKCELYQQNYKNWYDKKNVVVRVPISVGNSVKIKFEERRGISKYTRPMRVVSVGKKCVKLEDGKFWNLDRVVRVK